MMEIVCANLSPFYTKSKQTTIVYIVCYRFPGAAGNQGPNQGGNPGGQFEEGDDDLYS